MENTGRATQVETQAGKKFFLNIEGTEHPWDRETITVPEIRSLGNLPPDLPVIMELPDGTEETLAEDAVVQLKPGHRFGRAPKFRRG